MKKSARAVLDEALRLEASERAAVAAELIASLDEGVDDDAEAACAAEI